MNVQTLVATDYDGLGLDISPVLAFIGGATVSVDRGTYRHFRTGVELPEYRITFDADQVRNTVVHGVGFNAGFVVSIEQTARATV